MGRFALIVDDNRDLAENLGEILEGEGFAVTLFADPQRAAEECDELSFDVALLDICMPGLDGIDLYRSLVVHHPNAMFFLMTGHGEDERMRNALAEGVRLVLFKPVSIPNLLRAVGPLPTV
jgi:CheY-like chemotaxis protein